MIVLRLNAIVWRSFMKNCIELNTQWFKKFKNPHVVTDYTNGVTDYTNGITDYHLSKRSKNSCRMSM